MGTHRHSSQLDANGTARVPDSFVAIEASSARSMRTAALWLREVVAAICASASAWNGSESIDPMDDLLERSIRVLKSTG